MMAAHEAFYSDLFSREMLDLTSQRDLFSYVKSRLSESEQASDQDLLKSGIISAIKGPWVYC